MKRISRIFLLSILLLFFQTCQFFTDDDVIFQSPKNGEILPQATYTIILKKPASIYEIDTCTTYLDGTQIDVADGIVFLSSDLYDFEYDFSTVSLGAHSLTAIIVDASHPEPEYNISNTIYIQVQNY